MIADLIGEDEWGNDPYNGPDSLDCRERPITLHDLLQHQQTARWVIEHHGGTHTVMTDTGKEVLLVEEECVITGISAAKAEEIITLRNNFLSALAEALTSTK